MSLIEEATLFVTVKANDEASQATKSMTSSFKGLAKAALAVGAAAVIAGVIAVGTASVIAAVKFQSLTATLAAQGDMSVKSATKVSNAFLGTMGTSIYSASAMMTAFTPVAGQMDLLTGHVLTAKQSLGLMKVASDLAEGSGNDLTSTTADLSKIMVAYQQPLKDAASDSNLLFSASRLTGQSLSALTQAMVRVRAQMGAGAPPLKAMGGLLVDLTKHGETGRQALTTLGSAFTGIITPTAAVTAAQNAMGISFKNATTGALDPLSQIFSELQPKLAGMSAVQAAATLKTLGFGSASIKLAQTLQAGPGVLSKYTTQVNATNAAHAAAQKQSQTFGHQMDLLKASFSDISVQIGQVFLPVLMQLMKAVISFVKPVLDWISTHRTLTVTIAGLAAGLAALVLVALAWKKIQQASKLVGDLWNDVQKLGALRTYAMTAATNIQKAALVVWSGVTKAAGAVQLAFNAVMDANPIMLVVAALALLIGGLVLFFTKTTLGKQVLHDISNAFQVFLGWLKTGWSWISSNWPLLLAILTGPIGLAVLWISTHVSNIVGFFKAIPGDIKSIWNTCLTDVQNFIAGVVTWFTKLPGKIVTALGSLAGDVGNVLKSIPVVGGLFSAVGHLATGGKALAGQTYMVGESGPEILQMTSSGGVVTPVAGGSAGSQVASSASPIGGSATVGGQAGGGGSMAAITVPVTLTLDGNVLAKVVAKRTGQMYRHQGLAHSGANS
jgi:TP901 family phage tail tape measure protein